MAVGNHATAETTSAPTPAVMALSTPAGSWMARCKRYAWW